MVLFKPFCELTQGGCVAVFDGGQIIHAQLQTLLFEHDVNDRGIGHDTGDTQHGPDRPGACQTAFD